MPDEEDEIVMKYSGLLGSHVEIQVILCSIISKSTYIGFIGLNFFKVSTLQKQERY